MLIGADSGPFNDKNYLFELKLDGERCIAYLDKNRTELRNKRNKRMLPVVPELSELHKCIRKSCILDGELIVIKTGRPDYYEIQRRSLMSNKFKVGLASKQYPASFTAFDILWPDGEDVQDKPLTDRKKLLRKTIKQETERFAEFRFIKEQGEAFFELAKVQELEGIVGKRRGSLYYCGKCTKDWIKIKNLPDDDFVVCGYIPKENSMTSLVLGQYDKDGVLTYKGYVTLGVSRESFRKISSHQSLDIPPFLVLSDNGEAARFGLHRQVHDVHQRGRDAPAGV